MSTFDFFASAQTPAEIKTLYRKLAQENHPDHGGSTETMQEINQQYLDALCSVDHTTEMGSDNKTHTYYYNEYREKVVMDKIDELLRKKMQGVEINLVGGWIWVEGNTFPNRVALASCKLIWHGKRRAWYWRPADARTHYNGNVSLDDLKVFYGSEKFENKEGELVNV